MKENKEVNYFLFPTNYKRFNIEKMYKEIKKNGTIKWAVTNRLKYNENDIVYIYYTNIEDRVNRILIRAVIKDIPNKKYFYFGSEDPSELKFEDKEKAIKKYYDEEEQTIDFNKEFSTDNKEEYKKKINKEAQLECVFLDGIQYLRPENLTRFHLYKVNAEDIANNDVLKSSEVGFGYGCFQQNSCINKKVYQKLIDEVENYCNKNGVKERKGQVLSIEDLYNEFVDKPKCIMENFDLKDYKGNKYRHYYYKRRSGYNGLVGHHFIPRSMTNGMNMDNKFYQFVHNNSINMIYICPNCHDRIHHGIKEDVYEMIKDIYEYDNHSKVFDEALNLLPDYKKCKTTEDKIEKLVEYYLSH